MRAWGAGIKRGKKIHLERVETWAFARTEPSPKMAKKPTMSSWRALKFMEPSSWGWSQCQAMVASDTNRQRVTVGGEDRAVQPGQAEATGRDQQMAAAVAGLSHVKGEPEAQQGSTEVDNGVANTRRKKAEDDEVQQCGCKATPIRGWAAGGQNPHHDGSRAEPQPPGFGASTPRCGAPQRLAPACVIGCVGGCMDAWTCGCVDVRMRGRVQGQVK
jgi:hypothetical protein